MKIDMTRGKEEKISDKTQTPLQAFFIINSYRYLRVYEQQLRYIIDEI